MFHLKGFKNCRKFVSHIRNYTQEVQIPSSAEVVIIGGGSQGCHTLYHLAKRGVKAVLLERAQLTAGTTWHTSGLVWSLRPNDVDIMMLKSSRDTLSGLEAETDLDPGWIKNGGIFIAHNETRFDEYKRLSSVGNSMSIENHVLTPEDTCKIHPLLNPKSFIGALYSPGDGVIDPAMLCGALTKAAAQNGGRVIENCPVLDILAEATAPGQKKIVGVSTIFGTIKTNTVVNATGVWGKNLLVKHGITLPLIAMKHAYIISESIPGARGLPNVRDHDYSIYLRIQGESIQMGGYEGNPILLEKVPKDFAFSLYDLDWSVFDQHLKEAVDLCPVLGKYGVKSTICGPESFTPDHKPLMGPDTQLHGLFHNLGFNSAGMMFGGGCAEQIASWIVDGRPTLHMFDFDIRRFTPLQTTDEQWIKERSHEAYAKNYSMVFAHDQPLAGRNLQKDPLHDDMLAYGAFMEEKQGWERPGLFLLDRKAPLVQKYDWYGNYGHTANTNTDYEKTLDGDLTYSFSKHHSLIGQEALACRTNAAVFNMSYFGKMYLDGPDSRQAADWIFTANTNREDDKTVYTCVLNNRGGVESDVTVTHILSGTDNESHNPKLDGGKGFYIVGGGAASNYSYSYIKSEIVKKGFRANLKDVTSQLGVISVQGPTSRKILQQIIQDSDLSDESLPVLSGKVITVSGKDSNKFSARILRVSFVGELGYELHVPKEYCSNVYRILMDSGKKFDLKNAGYRALYSLSSEKGYHLWGFDLRSDDTPLEANLGFTCRKNGDYLGKDAVDQQKMEGCKRRLAYFTLNDNVPVWGLEGLYRNGQSVGQLRRGEYAYALGKSFGAAYVSRNDGEPINNEYVKSGNYQLDIMGKLYDVECHLRSPFDPQSKRVLGIYS